MDLIYKCARVVAILLDDFEVSKEELDFLESFVPDYESCADAFPHLNDNPPYLYSQPILRSLILKILNARWFTRAWCTHEMRLSKSHVFLIRAAGRSTIVRLTGNFFLYLMALGGSSRHESFTSEKILSQMLALVPTFGTAAMSLFTIEPGGFDPNRVFYSPMNLFAAISKMGAGGDPRLPPHRRELDANSDRLSIVLNTMGIGLMISRERIQSEYANFPVEANFWRLVEAQCCYRMAVLALAIGDPLPLCTAGYPLKLDGKTPSWLFWPLPTDIQDLTFHLQAMSEQKLVLDKGHNAEYIELDVEFFDTEGNFHTAKSPFLEKAQRFFHICDGLGLHAKTFPRQGFRINRQEWHCLKSQVLACALECGIPWMVKEAQTTTNNNYDARNIINGAGKLLAEDFGQDSGFKMARENSYPSEIESVALLELTRHLTDQGISWSSEGDLTGYYPFWMENCSGAKMLMFSRSEIEVRCAIPKSLATSRYSALRRGWLLSKKVAQEGSLTEYHLEGKIRTFAQLGSESGDLLFSSSVERARVYGPSLKTASVEPPSEEPTQANTLQDILSVDASFLLD